MKNTILVLLVAVAATGVSPAATIAVGRGGSTNGYTTFTAGGTNLSLTGGFYFSVGTFATEPVITTPASLLSALTNQYSEFAAITTPTSGATIGSLTGSFVATNSAFNSVPMYFVVGNGVDKASSTQFAILKGDPTAFAFPASAGSPSGAASITLSGAATSSPLANAGTELEILNLPDSLTLVDTIPEPSVALLGAFGALGLLRRRRN